MHNETINGFTNKSLSSYVKPTIYERNSIKYTMKKVFGIFAVAAGLFAMASCTSVAPVCATSNNVGSKCGTATETKILGIFPFTGDHGINAAAKNGGVSKISHVDMECYNICGYIYTKTTTRVYGN